MGQMTPDLALPDTEFSMSWYLRGSERDLSSGKTESIHCKERSLRGLLSNSGVSERFQVWFTRCAQSYK